MTTAEVLHKIFRNPEEELLMFDDLGVLNIYEKDNGKFYLASFSWDGVEKEVYNPKNGNSHPEEIVRQLYLHHLIKHYKYHKNLIQIEKVVHFGRETNDAKRADIVVYKADGITPKIIVEVKAPGEKHDIQQLKSYLNAEGAIIGVALNGEHRLILYRPYPKDFDDTLDDIPAADEDVADVLERRKTLKDLKDKDLRRVITDLEELVLANSGADSFDEIFKLIYAKLYDEKAARSRPNEELHFRKSPTGKPEETKRTIEILFDDAKLEWPDIFDRSARITLSPEHLSVCVGELQDTRLFGSNLRIVDEAFEYLIPDVAKGKKGQYFTPRVIIDMCVNMLNPKPREYVIDTACGSAGFLVHAMQYVWKQLKSEEAKKEYAGRYLYGIDFDEKSTKISRAIMLIAGDGKSHIFRANSIDGVEWQPELTSALENFQLVEEWENDTEKTRINHETHRRLRFDILLANPPFAGEIKEKKLLTSYALAKNAKGKLQTSLERHILFIERNLDFVRDGGRLAVVLPQGVFNNTSEQYIREYIMKKARILAIVGLDGSSFKPHTGTKTSVIFLQKWKVGELNAGGEPKVKDYPIFFATSRVPFKNNSGEYVYQKAANGEVIKDEDGNPKYNTDLDGIAEAFVLWAKEQRLDFLELI